MEDKKFTELDDQAMDKISGGTSELKGNRNYNPLRTCPLCGERGQIAYGDGRAYFVCHHCHYWLWFEDDGSLHWTRGG